MMAGIKEHRNEVDHQGDRNKNETMRVCVKCGTENARSDHRCRSCNERMETRPGYFVPEPGDEDLSPMMLDCKYHVPFEGTLFALRPSPDPEILTELSERKKRRGRRGK